MKVWNQNLSQNMSYNSYLSADPIIGSLIGQFKFDPILCNISIVVNAAESIE